MKDKPTKQEALAEEQAAAELLRARLAHPTAQPPSELIRQWDDYHRLIDPDRG